MVNIAYEIKRNVQNEPKNKKEYTVKIEDYTLLNSYVFDPEKTNLKDGKKDNWIQKNLNELLLKKTGTTREKTIKETVDFFFAKKSVDYLKYSISKNVDSNSYTVSIVSQDMSFRELFNLARKLNRSAVWEDLGFTVIAGV